MARRSSTIERDGNSTSVGDGISTPTGVTGTFKLNEAKKNSVRFDGEGDETALSSSFYLANWASQQLGDPQRIRVTVEKID